MTAYLVNRQILLGSLRVKGFVRKHKTRAQEGDQAGFYKHLETINGKGSETTARRTSKTRTIYS